MLNDLITPAESYGGFEALGVLDVAWSLCKTPKYSYDLHGVSVNFFFSQRVIQVWNSSPSNVIVSMPLKSRLSKIDLSSFCKVYDF